MKEGKPPLTKLANNLYRCTQAYANEALAKYKLSSGTYPYLLTLYEKEGINQNQISKELNIDKAMSARAIKRLIELEYLIKEEDHEDSRAYRLFLTEKGKAIVPLVKKELYRWNAVIAKGLSAQEEEAVINLLSKVLENAQRYRK
ncbi:MarR family transcriptional regulator [Petroclostridium sp. X23]|uniref:MarR family winged helix-turn-helix transcriptional regulator n=1 Tax=Petroclostridium sp. X23 TaxID=3045146 RepID=UPI0024ACEF9B|nr:MarR family transcriptional regulator [Petroclostridium sp. X23]WHH57851.1 MarR family transcriptional regulator [Petroclostridium sp. X23]